MNQFELEKFGVEEIKQEELVNYEGGRFPISLWVKICMACQPYAEKMLANGQEIWGLGRCHQ